MLEQTPERECDRTECAICLSPLNRIDNEITQTKCMHLFHKDCLGEMTQRHLFNCPVCRHKLSPPQNLPPLINTAPTIQYHYANVSSSTQEQIVMAAQRGRNAVR